MNCKSLYICSLPRSGSTYLQALLATHPEFVAIGEAARVARNYGSGDGSDPIDELRERIGMNQQFASSPRCSCGEQIEHCELWGPLLPRLQGAGDEGAMAEILRFASERFPAHWIIDSSKSLASLKQFYRDSQSERSCTTKVLLLVRDVRAWVRSVSKHNHVRAAKLPFKRWTYNYIGDSYRWRRFYRRAASELTQDGMPYLVVSYERLIFRQRQELERIAEFVGIDAGAVTTDLRASVTHELYGSQSMKSAFESTVPQYDYRWFFDRRPVLYAPLLFPVGRLNASFHAA